MAEQGGHGFHVGCDMGEEALEALTEITLAELAGRGGAKAVFQAVTMAGEAHGAFAARARERVAFCVAEGELARAVHHVNEWRFHDVAETVARVDIVITSIEITVVFEDEGGAAAFGEDAERAAVASPTAEGDIKILHEDCADVVADPLIENGDEEFAEAAGVDAPFRDWRADGRAAGGGRLGEIQAKLTRGFVGQALNQRNELHERHAEVFEKVVYFERMTFIGRADDCQRIEVYLMIEEQMHATDDVIERR